jgi:hypothetical protein
MNVFFHLVLDAAQIKWANGVHFVAPFDWQLTCFNFFWPESPATYLLTAFGLIYFAANRRELITAQDLTLPRSALRCGVGLIFVIVYFSLPFFLVDGSERAGNHYVKTLREVESRQGRYIEFDRVGYQPRDEGGVLTTFAGEKIGVTGMKLGHPATVSVRGRFVDNNSVRVSEYHIHSDWLRDAASYAGLALVAGIWLLALLTLRLPKKLQKV